MTWANKTVSGVGPERRRAVQVERRLREEENRAKAMMSPDTVYRVRGHAREKPMS